MTRFTTWILLAALLSIGGGLASAAAQEKGDKAPSAALAVRLQPKIHKIQKELPDWLEDRQQECGQAHENVARTDPGKAV